MKRKFFLIVALVLAVVVSGGIFAYTYTTTSITGAAVTAAGADLATCNKTVSQPDWDSILDDLESDNITRGEVPTGDLFEVTLHPDYSGDLAVKVHLSNTRNLTKAYQYLNVKLYLEGSTEAGETPNYRLLTLETGLATFSLEGGGSDNRTLSVTGGGYGLNSRQPLEWEEGWTVTPELYCEITQR